MGPHNLLCITDVNLILSISASNLTLFLSFGPSQPFLGHFCGVVPIKVPIFFVLPYQSVLYKSGKFTGFHTQILISNLLLLYACDKVAIP